MKKGLAFTLVLTLGLGAMVGCASNNKTTNVAECSEIAKEEMEVIKVLKDIKSSIDKQNQLEEMKAKQEVVRLLKELSSVEEQEESEAKETKAEAELIRCLHELSDVKEPERINQEEN